MFKRIDTVFVYVKNLRKAVAWYKKILKLDIGLDYPGYVSFKLGETYLTLIENINQVNKEWQSFNFFVNDAKEVYAYLVKEKVKVTPIKHDGVDYFSFFDLDGNQLGICSF